MVLITGQIHIVFVDFLEILLNDHNVRMRSIVPEDKKTILEPTFSAPATEVTIITSIPMEMILIPSTIHSIITILLLSPESSPKTFNMDFVGIRWVIPQMMINKLPEYNRDSADTIQHLRLLSDTNDFFK